MISNKKSVDKSEKSVEERLAVVYKLQLVDSEIDKIKILRGELPLLVKDLEDEIAGLETRMKKFEDEIKDLEKQIAGRKNQIKDSEALIRKYETQQGKVRNNREFEAIAKETEYQQLEIQLCEKRIAESNEAIKSKRTQIERSASLIEERKADLEHKKGELEQIIAETREKEESYIALSKNLENAIEARLLNAYKRIRTNVRNGLAVVTVQRDACGGCFNKIPPQRQLEIKSRKKIIVCEHCGRILVDEDLAALDA